ncbi:hypothetical protein [Lysobacter enzymogenes]|uniref:hypothetical protein n=1 Tax=Lysobacter enzymogenes TaxID=69 RepID=UPI0009D13646|nr:hypothetical protein [Lysobacter enzymogenes]QQQ01644.1 hypothetical protein JHW41_01270 [Lysobacter enzymogenes]UZW60917.1 hypothetical protein BV903_001105 [Lysobacter enzymogenes]
MSNMIGVLAADASVEIMDEEFIPLILSFGDRGEGDVFLRFVSDVSLLELGVSADDQALSSIRLVHVPKLSDLQIPAVPVDCEVGLPMFDLHAWGGRKRLDVTAVASLAISSSSAFIAIGPVRTTDKVVRCGNLYFATADGQLAWIHITDLSVEQLSEIKSEVR